MSRTFSPGRTDDAAVQAAVAPHLVWLDMQHATSLQLRRERRRHTRERERLHADLAAARRDERRRVETELYVAVIDPLQRENAAMRGEGPTEAEVQQQGALDAARAAAAAADAAAQEAAELRSRLAANQAAWDAERGALLRTCTAQREQLASLERRLADERSAAEKRAAGTTATLQFLEAEAARYRGGEAASTDAATAAFSSHHGHDASPPPHHFVSLQGATERGPFRGHFSPRGVSPTAALGSGGTPEAPLPPPLDDGSEPWVADVAPTGRDGARREPQHEARRVPPEANVAVAGWVSHHAAPVNAPRDSSPTANNTRWAPRPRSVLPQQQQPIQPTAANASLASSAGPPPTVAQGAGGGGRGVGSASTAAPRQAPHEWRPHGPAANAPSSHSHHQHHRPIVLAPEITGALAQARDAGDYSPPAAAAASKRSASGEEEAARRRARAVRAVVDRMRHGIESPTDSDDERRRGEDDLFLLRPLLL